MPYFNTIIGGHRFAFNRIYTIDGTKYHVSVKDGSTSHYFMMDDRHDSWVFSERNQDLPKWIVECEKQIEQAILNHLANI